MVRTPGFGWRTFPDLSMVDRWPRYGQTVRCGGANQANSAFHSSEVGKWVDRAFRPMTFHTQHLAATVKFTTANSHLSPQDGDRNYNHCQLMCIHWRVVLCRVITRDDACTSKQALGNAIDMWVNQSVDAYLGPPCSIGMHLLQGRPEAPPTTQNASRKSSGTKMRKLGEYSKTYLWASLIPKIFRGGSPGYPR